ncbi:MAG: GNAT family N-acetyltransferase [Firmicutes bacterium]|nr:GNAT family N-acetyltransferase [Bacillota bacterium]
MDRITENQNILIREVKFRDYEYFAEWEKDPEVTAYLSFDEDRSYEDVVNEAIRDKNDDTKMDLTIVDKRTDQPIGRILVTRIDRHSDSLDVTKLYIGEKELRGKGLGEEIMRLLLAYFFTFMHMERVSLDYYTGNKNAQNLYEKLGFKAEGIARNATKKNGRYYDLNLMSMLRSEFFNK